MRAGSAIWATIEAKIAPRLAKIAVARRWSVEKFRNVYRTWFRKKADTREAELVRLESEPPEQDDAPRDDEDDPNEDDEVEAIAASPEAKSNPQLALAAIEADLTYEQFRATAATVAARPRGANVLGQLLANSPRLGPDVVSADESSRIRGGARTVDAASVYAARRGK